MTSHLRPIASAFLLGAASATAYAQARPSQNHQINLTLAYQTTRSNAGPGDCGCFFLQGGGAQLIVPLARSLFLAVDVAGGKAGKAYLGYDLSLLTYSAGPQFRMRLGRALPFTQVLFGAAQGGGLPFGNTGKTSASSFVFMAGGGLDIPIRGRVAVRAFSADYQRTQLPNGTNDAQNNLRLGAGVTFSLTK